MTIRCEDVRKLLERFYDRELKGKQLTAVTAHVQECVNCSKELERIERVGRALKAHYEQVAVSESLSGMWNRVSEAIETPAAAEPLSFREKLLGILRLPKPAWAAVAAVAVAVILVFAYLPGNQDSTFAANDCIIDSVVAENCSIMVYETGNAGMKVIWVMDEGTSGTNNNGGVTS
ncbi:MAG: zf-HC2 domain-containing protein [Candidatus Abyssobacteria bacterium SURF_17]|uniref:Zf-HC2 domain-containing protein n=1 Tax=Candidatus Abyssobacteria bacterium SURF_17 TaxID=2093361 RepID=A0A419F413_9BACT|nr:MAG: zf-HC2 domain-containing protein [Candidatus Abyssubacteria bacterium SURF_17]